ncbi:hypothetical protein ACFQU7_23980 [Pseudoroseomonas wenyumeiae]
MRNAPAGPETCRAARCYGGRCQCQAGAEPGMQMQVVEIRGQGGPEVLHLAQRPVPACGPGEVLVQVAAAGVNRPDVQQRKGSTRRLPA